MISGAQIRAARHGLKWNVEVLSEKSGVSTRTLKRMEADNGVPNSNLPNIMAVKAALEAAGIEFIGTPDDGPGIRIYPGKKPT